MPVVEFYDTRPKLWSFSPAQRYSVTFAVLDSGGQVEGDQSEAGLPIRLIFKPEDVLMPLRTSLQLKAVVAIAVLVIDLYVAMAAIIRAGESF